MSVAVDRGHAFRIMLRMLIKPGMEREFERVWSEVGDSVTSHPANLGQWLCRSEEEGIYYIVSDWIDEPRFREFETSAAHLEHRQKLHPFRAAGSMVTMEVIANLTAKGGGHGREDEHRTGPGHTVPEVLNGEVRVLVHYRATEPEPVCQAYHEVSSALAGAPGMLGNELLESVAGRPGFVVLSRWRDLESFVAWEQGTGHRGNTAPLRQFQDSDLAIPYAVYHVRAAY